MALVSRKIAKEGWVKSLLSLYVLGLNSNKFRQAEKIMNEFKVSDPQGYEKVMSELINDSRVSENLGLILGQCNVVFNSGKK